MHSELFSHCCAREKQKLINVKFRHIYYFSRALPFVDDDAKTVYSSRLGLALL